MRYLLLIILLFSFQSCGTSSISDKKPDTPKIEITIPKGQTEIEAYKNELAKTRGNIKELQQKSNCLFMWQMIH
jgi:hypothetical protein